MKNNYQIYLYKNLYKKQRKVYYKRKPFIRALRKINRRFFFFYLFVYIMKHRDLGAI